MYRFGKFLLALMFPGALLAAIAVAWRQSDVLAARLAGILPYLPWLLLLSGGLIGWRFNRSRLLQLLLLLGLAGLTFAPPPLLAQAGRYREWVTLLLPLNLLALAFCRDYRPTAPRGFGMTALIILQGLALVIPGLLSGTPPLPLPQIDLLPGLPALPQPQVVFVTTVACAGILVLRTLFKPEPLEGSFAWVVLFAAAAGCNLPPFGAWTWLALAGGGTVIAVLEQSYVLAYHDELTGLPGRRALNVYLQGSRGGCTVAMVDVDHFKKFNDKHGHDVGDQVLKMVATHLRQVGGGGRSYRYGGEEFTVLFPGRKLAGCMAHLEELRTAVAGARFVKRRGLRIRKRRGKSRQVPDKRELKVTISIGVAELAVGQTPELALKRADQALYRAKQAGRNQVCR